MMRDAHALWLAALLVDFVIGSTTWRDYTARSDRDLEKLRTPR